MERKRKIGQYQRVIRIHQINKGQTVSKEKWRTKIKVPIRRHITCMNYADKYMLEKTEGKIMNRQSRDNCNMTRQSRDNCIMTRQSRDNCNMTRQSRDNCNMTRQSRDNCNMTSPSLILFTTVFGGDCAAHHFSFLCCVVFLWFCVCVCFYVDFFAYFFFFLCGVFILCLMWPMLQVSHS